MTKTRTNRHLAWQNVTMLFLKSVWWYRLFCWHSWCWYFTLVGFFRRAFERRVLLKVVVCYTSSPVHIFITSSSHLHHIFSSLHLHIFSSSHLHIFSSSHLHIFSSPRLHILTSSQLHIFTSSHLHIFTSSHLHKSSHPHICTSSHIFSLSLSLFLFSCPLSRSLSFFLFSLLRPQAVPTRRHDMGTLSHEMRFECQKLRFFFCEFRWSC